ncbi:unnamed protein product [Discula destructiva]
MSPPTPSVKRQPSAESLRDSKRPKLVADQDTSDSASETSKSTHSEDWIVDDGSSVGSLSYGASPIAKEDTDEDVDMSGGQENINPSPFSDDSLLPMHDESSTIVSSGDINEATTGNSSFTDDTGFIDGAKDAAYGKNDDKAANDSVGRLDNRGCVDDADVADISTHCPISRTVAKEKALTKNKTPVRRKVSATGKVTASEDQVEVSDAEEPHDVQDGQALQDDDAPEDPAFQVILQGPDLSLPPLHKLREIIQDLTEKASKNGLQDYVDANKQFFLSVGTVCSGTDAPLHVLNLFGMLKNANGDQVFTTVNKFACEIEPFKQGFLLRNSKPNMLFRDVTEFAAPGAKRAHLVSGAEADIPEVDIFIAGTSCVDFSALNTRKTKEFSNLRHANDKWNRLFELKKDNKAEEQLTRKDLKDDDWRRCIDDMMAKKGVKRTSTTTFASAMNYIKERQPKIVIFENVYGAPWASTLDYVFPLTGYTATFVGLDTKDYYLPQTRLRKYVVAFNMDVFGVDGAKMLCKTFKTVVKALERKYSSAITDFLLPSNSHELHRARNEMELASQATQDRDTDWAFSRSRHTQFRRTEGIPDERQWIQWRENGSSNAPAKMWKAWEARQPNRVKDLLECFYSLAVAGKNKKHGTYDPAHKAQILDASQNVDRASMTQPFGGTGCLTPNAIPFLSLEARPITGSEALKLQGMPIENFDMSIETQAQLQDLAGNAMSTTVVGAVILSALASVAKYDRQNKKGWLQDQLFLKRDFEFISKDSNSFRSLDVPVDSGNVHQLDDLMLSAHTPCNVDEILLLGEKTRRRCVCQHILAYSSMDICVCEVCGASLCKSCKGNPEHQMVKSRESFHDIGSLTYANACDQLRQYFPSILPMLARSQDLARQIVQVLQSSAYTPEENLALADAVLAGLCGTIYELSFVEITDATRIEYVSKGNFILRAIIEKDNLTWFLHLDKWSMAAKTLHGHKTCQPIAKATLHSGASSQFPAADDWELWVPREVQFSLKFSLQDKQDLLLESIGDVSHIQDDATRRTIQELECSQWKYHPECGMAERAFWVCNTPSIKLFMFMDVNPIGPSQRDRFVMSSVCREMGRAPQAENRPVLLQIRAGDRIHKILNNTNQISVEACVDGWWSNLAQHSVRVPAFKNDLSVFAEHDFPITPPASIRLASDSTDLAIHNSAETCSRDQVLLSMSLPIFGQSEIAVQKLVQTMRDFDLAQQLDLAEFAHLIGPCYAAIERAIIDYSGGSRSIQLWDVVLTEDCGKCAPKLPEVVFEKPATRGAKSVAAHHETKDEEAYTRSLMNKPSSFRIDHNVLIDIPDTKKNPNIRYVDVRFVGRAHTLMQQARSYLSKHPSFHGDGLKTGATFSIGLGVLEDPRLALAAIKIRPPPPAASAPQPRGFKTDMTVLPEQLASLEWMTSRENDECETTFTEKEVAEVYIDHLRLRTFAQASRNIIRRGRILADEVGFGKTAVCLGLIDRQREVDLASRSKRQQNPGLSGFAHLKATLVIVPNHLTQQWKAEADRFLHAASGFKIIIIETYPHLLFHSDKLHDADIIICSNQIFKHKTYKEKLLAHSNTNGVNIAAFPKVYRSWYKKVLANLRPPRNLSAKSAIDILEYCTFARVIWDEFPYENTEVSEFVTNCMTTSKWMLSGTPPLASLGQVCKIADLFNVHLARPLSLVAGRQPQVCENEALEPLSQLEQAQLYQSRPSPGFLRERHDQLLRFVRKFFSKNQRESNVESSQLPVVLSLSSNSRSAYMDLQQDLAIRTYNANLLGSETRRRLMSRVDWKEKKHGLDRAVEALALRASISFADVKDHLDFQPGQATTSTLAIADAMHRDSVRTIEGLEDRGRELLGKASYLAYRVAHVNVRNHGRAADSGEARQFSYYKTLQNFKESVLAVDFEETYRGWDAFESAMRILIWDEQFEQALSARSESMALPLWSDKDAWKDMLKTLWDSMSFGVITDATPAPSDGAMRTSVLDKKLEALEMFSEFVTKTPLHSRRWFGVQGMTTNEFDSWPHLLEMEWEHKLPWELHYRSQNGDSSAVLVPVRDLRRPVGDEQMAPFNLATAQQKSQAHMDDAINVPADVGLRVTRQVQARCGVSKILKKHWEEECLRRGLIAKSTERLDVLKQRVALAEMGKASEEHWINPQGCALKFTELPKEGRVSIRGGTMEKLFDELMHTVDALTIVIGRLAPAHGKRKCLKVIFEVLAGTWRCDEHPDYDAAAVSTHYVSLVCGHVHCSLPHHTAICGKRGCTAPLRDVCIPLEKFVEQPRIIKSTDLGKDALVKEPKPYLSLRGEGMGPKINAVIGLIDSMAEDDQVVVFAQNIELLKDMYNALQTAGITHVTAKELQANESKALEAFKNSAQAQKAHKKQVLVQLLNSEQAAGSNLHNANHVIFVSPLITRSQAAWDAQMQQALGRCVRFRQQKLVHVYHMAMADTVEVDMLEWRHKKEVLLRPGASVGRFHECDAAEFLERFDAVDTFTGSGGNGEQEGWERAISMLPRSEIQMLMGDDYVSVTMARSKATVESRNAAMLELQETDLEKVVLLEKVVFEKDEQDKDTEILDYEVEESDTRMGLC